MHVAIIMDGNGRWAQRRGLVRLEGHRKGIDAVRCVIESAPRLRVDVLSLYAFSSDNWKRPAEEVSGLMSLLRVFLDREVAACVRNGVRLSFVGRRDRLPANLLPPMEDAEERTRAGDTLHLRIAIDYSSRDELRQWFKQDPQSALHHLGPDVDLLIRTGGEQRLSDFLLWQCAYAELYFTPVPWPEFGFDDFSAAIAEFHQRQRRFGGLPGCKIVRNDSPQFSAT
ncbi:MAG: polyprenyl diphosphate synthase [Bryobacter sp.]|nr:polyprenyl diphosphate synthase [Bryobacter sp.]